MNITIDGSKRAKLREHHAWRVIAEMLEERHTALAYDPTPQPSLCECVPRLRRMGAITAATCCKMLFRLHLFSRYLDSKSWYWDRYYKASREQRILAAWFLHHMSKGA